MTNPKYVVTHPRRVAEQLQLCIDEAKRRGLLVDVIENSKRMMWDLEYRPYEIGESRESYPVIKINCRVAFYSHLFVAYGIHDATKLVIIQSIRPRFPKSN